MEGKKNTVSRNDSIVLSKLCNKTWSWIEGLEDKNKYGSFVFSLLFATDGFVTYNQRKTPCAWKIFNETYVEISVDKKLINNEEHPYGILEGKFLIAENTDSFLVLKKLKTNKKEKESTFKLVRDEFFNGAFAYDRKKPAVRDTVRVIPVWVAKMYYGDMEGEYSTEPGKIIITKRIKDGVYKKVVYHDRNETEYYLNDLKLPGPIIEPKPLGK